MFGILLHPAVSGECSQESSQVGGLSTGDAPMSARTIVTVTDDKTGKFAGYKLKTTLTSGTITHKIPPTFEVRWSANPVCSVDSQPCVCSILFCVRDTSMCIITNLFIDSDKCIIIYCYNVCC